MPIFGFSIPYFIIIGIFHFIGAGHTGPLDFETAFYKAIDSRITLFISFVFALFSVYLVFNKKIAEKYKLLTGRIDTILVNINKSNLAHQNEIDKYLKRSKIVFESGINEFDDDHLLIFKKILNELQSYQKNKNTSIHIYAIDNTDPKTWWSDTMTGYLALLSNWYNTSNGKNLVSRIFVCQKNELLSPIFVKTVALHSFMGFDTYIFTIENFKELYNIFKSNNGNKKIIHYKEFLLWFDHSKSNNITVPINFKSGGHIHPNWNNVKGYMSFWEIGTDYNQRQIRIKEGRCSGCKNYYNENMQDKEIKIWFDFIAKENKVQDKNENKLNYWENLVPQYIKFYEYLINKTENEINTICCKNSNDIINNTSIVNKPFGIQIKTTICSNCKIRDKNKCPNYIENEDGTNFDFVSQKNVEYILKEYYNQITMNNC